MFLSKILVFCAVATTVAGYGYGYGSYRSEEEEKSECKKLKHYDVTPLDDAHLNRKAKFTHLSENGKDYVMIQCPNDGHTYALISENSGSAFDISGALYPNTVVLAAGFKVGFLAKCDGKKILAETTDGKKIRLDKVACIQYSEPGADNAPACASCQIDELEAANDSTDGTTISFQHSTGSDGCKYTLVKCETSPNSGCLLGVHFYAETGGNTVAGLPGETSFSKLFACDGDGLYKNNEFSKVRDFTCGLWCPPDQ